jgi:hypothetical protein
MISGGAMRQAFLGFSLLLLAAQEAPQAPWRTDVQAARESAVQQGRPCVLFLYVDSL